MITIHALLSELQSFLVIPERTLAAAKESDITNKNNKEFQSLVRAWSKGSYDEDPQQLLQELNSLLPL